MHSSARAGRAGDAAGFKQAFQAVVDVERLSERRMAQSDES
jgi:hypothetical protein